MPEQPQSRVHHRDARVGGGFAEPIEEPCLGEACKGPLSDPPALLGPGTPGFFGPGNPKRPKKCRKGFVRKHGKCVKKKHRRQKKRQAGHNRGGRR